ncbi:MAG: hypothetical protein PF441_11330, partial [Desulfuromusa sp.]|nr:hypothetical protein [Desulfuromusa sp.]
PVADMLKTRAKTEIKTVIFFMRVPPEIKGREKKQWFIGLIDIIQSTKVVKNKHHLYSNL